MRMSMYPAGTRRGDVMRLSSTRMVIDGRAETPVAGEGADVAVLAATRATATIVMNGDVVCMSAVSGEGTAVSPERVRNLSPCQHGTAVPPLAARVASQYARCMSLSARLTILVVAFTAAAFAAAAVVAAGAPSYRAFGVLGLAALLAVPSIVVAFLVERRRPTGWLGPMLALTGFLPSLVLLGDVFKHGPLGDYTVSASQGSWVLLYLSAALLVLFFPEGRLRGHDRLLAGVIVADALLFMAAAAMWPKAYPAPYEQSPHVFGTMPYPLAVAIVATTLPGVLVTLVFTVG
jgi:hypothetical protein